MRVLQAMAGARHGGAEAFFVRLCLALRRAGLTQRLLIRSEPSRAATLRAGGLDPVEVRFGGPLDLASRRAFRAEVDRFRPDVVLTWMSRATAACPRGAFVHAARLGGYYNLKYYRRADHLIGNTRDICEHAMRSGWPPERVHYLPNFVDAARAAPASRAQYDTPDGAPLLLALGRLHPNKAFDVLLDALADLPGVWLWLFGEGPLRAELQRRAERLGVAHRVRMPGWTPAPGPLYAAADVVVVPSRLEPLGNVVIEAWAQEKPVVAASSVGPAALIRDGVSGVLAPPNDAGALAGALRRVLESRELAAELAAGGRKAYEAEFTEAAVVRRYLAFFAEVARRAPSAGVG